MNTIILILALMVSPMPPAPAPNESVNEFLQEVQTKGIDQVLAKLSISEMENLYAVLIQDPQTEALALRIWELRDQKEKIETAPIYGNPRITLVAKSKEMPTLFWIGLSDGSFWEVDPSHLGGDDPYLQKILINSALGNYIQKVDSQMLEMLYFPSGNFAGIMHVKSIQGVHLEEKDVYFLGHGGFVK